MSVVHGRFYATEQHPIAYTDDGNVLIGCLGWIVAIFIGFVFLMSQAPREEISSPLPVAQDVGRQDEPRDDPVFPPLPPAPIRSEHDNPPRHASLTHDDIKKRQLVALEMAQCEMNVNCLGKKNKKKAAQACSEKLDRDFFPDQYTWANEVHKIITYRDGKTTYDYSTISERVVRHSSTNPIAGLAETRRSETSVNDSVSSPIAYRHPVIRNKRWDGDVITTRKVTKDDFGNKWPLVVESGVLGCTRGSVIFSHKETMYAVNGWAGSRFKDYPRIKTLSRYQQVRQLGSYHGAVIDRFDEEKRKAIYYDAIMCERDAIKQGKVLFPWIDGLGREELIQRSDERMMFERTMMETCKDSLQLRHRLTYDEFISISAEGFYYIHGPLQRGSEFLPERSLTKD